MEEKSPENTAVEQISDTRHKEIQNAEDLATQNSYAAKADDSDGHVPMTPRRFLAMAFLYMSFAGKSPTSTSEVLKVDRLGVAGANLPLFFTVGSLSYIQKDVGNPATQGWAGTTYGIAVAALIPFCGYLQDLFGRRYFTVFGCFMMCLGAVVEGTAHSFTQLIFALVISGFGAAIVELSSVAGIAEVVSVKNRGLALSLLTGFILPWAPYQLYSELLASHTTWRWTMWINLMYNALCFVGVLFTYFPESHHRADGIGKIEALKQLDFMGGFLSLSSVVLFLFALQSGDSLYPWASAKVLVPLIIGVLLAFVFVVWEVKGAKYPMVPASIFQGQRIVGPALVLSFTIGMDLYAVLTFMPLAFGAIYDSDPKSIGIKALGYAFGQTLGATVGNIMMTLIKTHQRAILAIGCVSMATFIASLALMSPDNVHTAVALTTLAGWSVGWVINPLNTVALSGTRDLFIATVIGLLLSTRYLGGSIGYSIYYAVFTAKAKKKLPNYVAAAVAKAGLPLTEIQQFVGIFLTNPEAISEVKGITPSIIQAATAASKSAYADSMKFVWYTSIPFGVACVIGVLVMKSTTKFVTNRVAARLE
ncbi:uncharacterized protein A1O5_09413 [Cladophialophora psammophila CBS 110553]|uniref:Major facilitator superfamily (MFS) profile domain-containing protein n=1 Tax=Cladophialophora psammophila CBS 110553 TaxID=1182543 RepID=W9WR04_9EURO|nr:uncharacterized protein A1O5_09413 [Cladophialophora psammophila CBS 110553]EXJ67400.1 hypothetical protein A1O5_09413 [Cladophialophora psammophila CBS 110553]